MADKIFLRPNQPKIVTSPAIRLPNMTFHLVGFAAEEMPMISYFAATDDLIQVFIRKPFHFPVEPKERRAKRQAAKRKASKRRSDAR